MPRLSSSLLLMLSAVALSGRTVDETGFGGDVTIYTRFARSASATSIEYMKAELHTVLPSLRFEWRSLEAADGTEVADQLMVVKFTGSCESDVPVPLVAPSGALGWTYVTRGEVLPFADVDCDKIRELLGPHLAGASPLERGRILGRAMARVLAHELYHYLTKATGHASRGLAKPFYTGEDLAMEHLRFEDAQLDLIRQSCAHGMHTD